MWLPHKKELKFVPNDGNLASFRRPPCCKKAQFFTRYKAVLPLCRDANLWRSEIWRFFFFSTPKKDRVRASNVYLNLIPGKLMEDFRGLPKTSEVDRCLPKTSDDFRC